MHNIFEKRSTGSWTALFLLIVILPIEISLNYHGICIKSECGICYVFWSKFHVEYTWQKFKDFAFCQVDSMWNSFQSCYGITGILFSHVNFYGYDFKSTMGAS